MNAAVGGHLERRLGGWNRHSAARIPLHVREEQVCGIERVVSVYIEAVPSALAVKDRYGAPFSHFGYHSEEKENAAVVRRVRGCSAGGYRPQQRSIGS